MGLVLCGLFICAGGGIALGLAHGFVSCGLFICAGGVLFDRCSTRLITNLNFKLRFKVTKLIIHVKYLGN